MGEDRYNLVKLVRMYQNYWPIKYKVCQNCGEYIPEGYICINCRYDPTTKKIRE